jgi:hypothetical protein
MAGIPLRRPCDFGPLHFMYSVWNNDASQVCRGRGVDPRCLRVTRRKCHERRGAKEVPGRSDLFVPDHPRKIRISLSHNIQAGGTCFGRGEVNRSPDRTPPCRPCTEVKGVSIGFALCNADNYVITANNPRTFVCLKSSLASREYYWKFASTAMLTMLVLILPSGLSPDSDRGRSSVCMTMFGMDTTTWYNPRWFGTGLIAAAGT